MNEIFLFNLYRLSIELKGDWWIDYIFISVFGLKKQIN